MRQSTLRLPLKRKVMKQRTMFDVGFGRASERDPNTSVEYSPSQILEQLTSRQQQQQQQQSVDIPSSNEIVAHHKAKKKRRVGETRSRNR